MTIYFKCQKLPVFNVCEVHTVALG